MKLSDFKGKWLNFIDKASKNGIPLPFVRDPKTGQGSVSLTLVLASFALTCVSILGKSTLIILKALHVAGLDKDTGNLLGSIETSQALNLFMACSALYWGRKFQGNSPDSIQVGLDPAKKE